MTFEFILPFGRLNLASLSPERREEIVQETRLIETEAVEVSEYGKNNDGYWDRAKLYQQVVKKALPIAEAFYPGYSLLFLFDNATSHSVYAKDALQVSFWEKIKKCLMANYGQLPRHWRLQREKQEAILVRLYQCLQTHERRLQLFNDLPPVLVAHI